MSAPNNDPTEHYRPNRSVRRAIGNALARAIKETGRSKKALTVLSEKRDPFRVDTPARHRAGRWLADEMDALDPTGNRPFHLRGLHYAFSLFGEVMRPCAAADCERCDGTDRGCAHERLYRNDDTDWTWITDEAAKAARWLGYVDWDRFIDERNDAPRCWIIDGVQSVGTPTVTAGHHVFLPDADDVMPSVARASVHVPQPWRLVLWTEKASTAPILAEYAERVGGDLYVGTGETSDWLMADLMRRANEDLTGRPTVVLVFADCEPNGWAMSTSIARKFQSLAATDGGAAHVLVVRAGLTPTQVHELRAGRSTFADEPLHMPDTPMKDTEGRGPAWCDLWGFTDGGQVEIDMLTVPQYEFVLRAMAEQAIAPWHDETLDARVAAVVDEWESAAKDALTERLGGTKGVEAIRAEVERRLAAIRAEVDSLNDYVTEQVGDAADTFDPLPELPKTWGHRSEAFVALLPVDRLSPNGDPMDDVLFSTRWPFVDGTDALIADRITKDSA